MTTNHTPEPWHIVGTSIHDRLTEFDASGARIGSTPNQIAETYSTPFQTAESNARHIVACVNACAGIPTADLENSQSRQNEQLTGYGKACAERDRLRDINAELLAALRDLQAYESLPNPPGSKGEEVHAAARAALKKAESWKP